jgi:outer membrane murein-binding lipoprotein Lpp
MNKFIVAAAVGTLVALTGCASKSGPTFGEELGMRSKEVSQVASQWNKGDDLAKKGANALEKAKAKQEKAAKLTQKADALSKDAAKLQENGQKWATEGATMKAASEAKLLELRAKPIDVPQTVVPTPEAQ